MSLFTCELVVILPEVDVCVSMRRLGGYWPEIRASLSYGRLDGPGGIASVSIAWPEVNAAVLKMMDTLCALTGAKIDVFAEMRDTFTSEHSAWLEKYEGAR